MSSKSWGGGGGEVQCISEHVTKKVSVPTTPATPYIDKYLIAKSKDCINIFGNKSTCNVTLPIPFTIRSK